MPKRNPPFNALHTFVITAKYLSFTQAAKVLFVTQGAVSRQINTLESFLGYRVFHRHARGLTLTVEGKTLLPEVSAGFEQISRATDCHNAVQNEVKIKAPTCLLRWLVPNLLAFQKQNNNFQVSLTTSTEHDVDFSSENFDAAIVFSASSPSSHNCFKLFDEKVTPVIANHLYSIEYEFNLGQFTKLHPTHTKQDWQLWQNYVGISDDYNSSHQYFETMELAISAAIQGFGIAIADITLVEEDVQMRRLVKPFAESVNTGWSYYLVYRNIPTMRLELSAFVEWFNERVN